MRRNLNGYVLRKITTIILLLIINLIFLYPFYNIYLNRDLYAFDSVPLDYNRSLSSEIIISSQEELYYGSDDLKRMNDLLKSSQFRRELSDLFDYNTLLPEFTFFLELTSVSGDYKKGSIILYYNSVDTNLDVNRIFIEILKEYKILLHNIEIDINYSRDMKSPTYQVEYKNIAISVIINLIIILVLYFVLFLIWPKKLKYLKTHLLFCSLFLALLSINTLYDVSNYLIKMNPKNFRFVESIPRWRKILFYQEFEITESINKPIDINYSWLDLPTTRDFTRSLFEQYDKKSIENTNLWDFELKNKISIRKNLFDDSRIYFTVLFDKESYWFPELYEENVNGNLEFKIHHRQLTTILNDKGILEERIHFYNNIFEEYKTIIERNGYEMKKIGEFTYIDNYPRKYKKGIISLIRIVLILIASILLSLTIYSKKEEI